MAQHRGVGRGWPQAMNIAHRVLKLNRER